MDKNITQRQPGSLDLEATSKAFNSGDPNRMNWASHELAKNRMKNSIKQSNPNVGPEFLRDFEYSEYDERIKYPDYDELDPSYIILPNGMIPLKVRFK